MALKPLYELRKKEIPVFGKWRYSFTSGMLFVPEMSGSLIRAAMVTSSRYWGEPQNSEKIVR